MDLKITDLFSPHLPIYKKNFQIRLLQTKYAFSSTVKLLCDLGNFLANIYSDLMIARNQIDCKWSKLKVMLYNHYKYQNIGYCQSKYL